MGDPSDKVEDLFERFWEWRLERTPEFASLVSED